MKIYTKTGDRGETGLFGGPRVPKHHPRIEAYGTVDELNAVLGMVRATDPHAGIDPLLCDIQHDLFAVGAELATPKQPEDSGSTSPSLALDPARISALEEAIDIHEQSVPALKQFILPGGTMAASGLHLARTVCRRAERRVVELSGLPDEAISTELVVYLNRLSDLLFVLARSVNASAGEPDIPWEQ